MNTQVPEEREQESGLPVIWKPQEIADYLHVSLSAAYQLLRTGRLRSIQIGKQYRIPGPALDEFISKETGI